MVDLISIKENEIIRIDTNDNDFTSCCGRREKHMFNICLGYTVLSRGKICRVVIYGKIIGFSNDMDITMLNYFFQFLFKSFFSRYLDLYYQNCPLQVISFLFMLSRMCHGATAKQCPAPEPIHSKALKGYTFKTLLNLSLFECLYYSHDEFRCQSCNYVLKENICEMNNRIKEAKPDQFVSDPDRLYNKRGAHRGKIKLINNLRPCPH